MDARCTITVYYDLMFPVLYGANAIRSWSFRGSDA